MGKTEVIFFFDTEDFTDPSAADAILTEAQICSEEGIKGHFAVVGKVCEALKKWGRDDIINALSKHVIGCHTYSHSEHPNICELSDLFSYDDAYRNIAERESLALDILHETFPDNEIVYSSVPGNSFSYVANYFYRDRGLFFNCGSAGVDVSAPPIAYCGLSQPHYTKCLDRMNFDDAEINAMLDELAKCPRVGIYTHPNRALKEIFWDELNYKGGNLCKPGEYILSPDRSREDIERFFDGFRKVIKRVKQDERFEVTDLITIRDKEVAKGRSHIKRSDIPILAGKLSKKFEAVGDLSLSDIFLAAAKFIRGECDEYIPGKTYGFLTKPYAVPEKVTVTADDVKSAVKKLDLSGFLPEKIVVGCECLGPTDLLFAMFDLLAGKEIIEVEPKKQLPKLHPELAELDLRGTWMHSDMLKEDYLSERLRLQCYTIYQTK